MEILEEKKIGDPLGAAEMNAFIDSYFIDPSQPSSSTSSTSDAAAAAAAAKKKADDEDLETLLKETDGMRDLVQEDLQHGIMGTFRVAKTREKKAVAAKTRYQKMSENERKIYNSKRRLKTLGLDPEADIAHDQPVRVQLKQANAKKAEAARMRYHRMTPEQKRDYNRRRTEAFRKRRREEEMLLSTPAGRISTEALARAQQIMIRNARKAESARLRYQKMSPEERRLYNMKRAKKTIKRPEIVGEELDLGEEEEDEDLDDEEDDLHDMELVEGSSSSEQIQQMIQEERRRMQQNHHYPAPLMTPLTSTDPQTSNDHLLHVINEVAHPTDPEIFAQMEKDVLRRTQKAQRTIRKQYTESLSSLVEDTLAHALGASNAIVGGIQYDVAPPLDLLGTIQSQGRGFKTSTILEQALGTVPTAVQGPSEKTHVIDEKMLQDMVRTGRDANGLPVEVRTVDGQRIRSIEDLIAVSHGQTVLITQQHFEAKPATFDPSTSTSYPTSGLTTGPPGPSDLSQYHQQEEDDLEDEEEDDYEEGDLKVNVTKARRAERARARYHRMSLDQRKEQNARRALMLRQMRAKDEQLCQLGESVVSIDVLDKQTAQEVRAAQARRLKRAEQARSKYHRMTADQRRRYNSNRDAQRKMRKEAEKQNFQIDSSTLPSTSNSQVPTQPLYYPHSTTSEA